MARNRFKGRKRLSLRFEALAPAVRIEIEAAAKKNAEEVADLVRRFAPYQSLKRATRAEGLSKGPAIRWRVVSGDEEVFWARWVEFGTQPGVRGQDVGSSSRSSGRRKSLRTHPGTKAKPYFFPAYRALRRRIKRRNSSGLRKAVQKVFK